MQAATQPASRPANSTAPLSAAAAVPLKKGADAPDFDLLRTDGKPAKLAEYQHRPLVLIFGSFSSPTFRQQAPALNELKKALARKSNFMVIYTREAHAVGEWEVERNRDDDLRVDQPTTIEARIRQAKSARDGLKLTLDMAVDGMDDKVTIAYQAFPNGAVILDGNRKVFAALRWAEAHALKREIDAVDKQK